MNFPGIIQKGTKNPEAIKLLKQQLNSKLGCNLDVNNPDFGDNTQARVIEFQNKLKLNPDGVVGELTWARLFEVPQPPIQVSAVTLAARALEVARTQLGVHEATGHNDGEAVESYLRSVGLGKGYAWCASFVYWCYSQASKALGVPNPLIQTGGVLDHWTRTKGLKTTTPQAGDIFIMDFGGGKGHTGFVKEVKGNMVVTIEGNTNDGGSREGDGVYERIRPMSSIKGYIRY